MAMGYQSKSGLGGMREKPRRVGPLQPVPKGLARLPGAAWEGAEDFATGMAQAQDLVLGAAESRMGETERIMRGVDTRAGGPQDPYGPKLREREWNYYQDDYDPNRANMGRLEQDVDSVKRAGAKGLALARQGATVMGPPGWLAISGAVNAGFDTLVDSQLRKVGEPASDLSNFVGHYAEQMDTPQGQWAEGQLEAMTAQLDKAGVPREGQLVADLMWPLGPMRLGGVGSRSARLMGGAIDPAADAMVIGRGEGLSPRGGGMRMEDPNVAPQGRGALAERETDAATEAERAAYRAREQERLAGEELGDDTDWTISTNPEHNAALDANAESRARFNYERDSHGIGTRAAPRAARAARPMDPEEELVIREWQDNMRDLRRAAEDEDAEFALDILNQMDELEHGSNVAFEARDVAEEFLQSGNNRGAATLQQAADDFADRVDDSIRDQFTEDAWRANTEWRTSSLTNRLLGPDLRGASEGPTWADNWMQSHRAYLQENRGIDDSLYDAQRSTDLDAVETRVTEHLENGDFDDAYALAQQYDFDISTQGRVMARGIPDESAENLAELQRMRQRDERASGNDAIAGTGRFSERAQAAAREVHALIEANELQRAIDRATELGYELVIQGDRPALIPRQGLRPEDLDDLGVTDPEAHAREAQRLMDEVDPPQGEAPANRHPDTQSWLDEQGAVSPAMQRTARESSLLRATASRTGRALESNFQTAREAATRERSEIVAEYDRLRETGEPLAADRYLRDRGFYADDDGYLHEMGEPAQGAEPDSMARDRAMADEDTGAHIPSWDDMGILERRALLRTEAAERAAGGPLANLEASDLQDLFEAVADQGDIAAARGIGTHMGLDDATVDARLSRLATPEEPGQAAGEIDQTVADQISDLLELGEVEDAVSMAERHGYRISDDQQSLHRLDELPDGSHHLSSPSLGSQLPWANVEGSTDEFIELLDALEVRTSRGLAQLPQRELNTLRRNYNDLIEGGATESAENLISIAGYHVNDNGVVVWSRGQSANPYPRDQLGIERDGVAPPQTWGLLEGEFDDIARLVDEVRQSTREGSIRLSSADEDHLADAVASLTRPGDGGDGLAESLLEAAGYDIGDAGELVHLASRNRSRYGRQESVGTGSEMTEAEMQRQQRLGLEQSLDGRAHDLAQPFEPSALHPAPTNMSDSLPARETDSVEEALAWARSGNHLKYADKAKTKFVGAPTEMVGREGLQAFRDNADDYFKRGLEALRARGKQPAWYPESRETIGALAKGRDAQSRFAREISLMSADAPPQANYAWAIEGHNARAVGGTPPDGILHTGRQWEQMQNDPVGPLSLKTGPFAQTLQPWSRGMTHPVTDRQMMEGLGYPMKSAKNATPTQHRFIDAEMLLAMERAQQASHGGRADWAVEDIQETIWTVVKAEGLMRQRNIGFDEAFDEAMADYSSFADWHRGYAEHSSKTSWADDEGRDILYDAIDFYQDPTIEAGAGASRVARPQVTVTGVPTGKFSKTGSPSKSGKQVGETDLAAMGKVEAFRGLMSGSDEGLAYSTQAYKDIPVGTERGGAGATVGQATGFTIEHGETLSPEQLQEVIRIGEEFGFTGDASFVSNRGTSTVVTRTDGPRGGLTRDLPQVHGALTEAGVPVKPGGLYPSRTDSVRTAYDWSEEGSGDQLRAMFKELDGPEAPKVLELLDESPESRARVKQHMDEASDRAIEDGTLDRKDLRNMRRIYSEGGLTALRQALADGAWLPSITLPLLLWAMGGEAQDET